MLEEVHVRDLALIEEAWLEFGPGMTVLTGETGAGKTALIGALKLLLGERADSGLVRGGAAEALVEGRFCSAGEEILARRRVGAEGRSRCTLNGEMATVGSLAETLGPLVDLHGQHEHQALLSAASHVGYLDRRAGGPAEQALASYREARAGYDAAVKARDTLAHELSEAARNADYLRFVVAEIAAVDPKPDEDAEIEGRLPALQHAERLSAAASEAVQLARGDGGATDRLACAVAALDRIGGIDPRLDALASRLADASALAEDVGLELRAYRDTVEHDPASLDAMMARHAELTGLMRKYGPRLSDVFARRDEAERLLEAVDAGADRMEAAERAALDCEAALRDSAADLAAVRAKIGPAFVEELAAAAVELAMPNARFEISTVELPFEQWTTDGPERVEFLYAPAPGQPARPLARIASGGEISRVMLALKGVLGEADTVETLVFDEIDAGIGGATAHAVADRLAALAARHQVIVVTHLAQVAARAETQLVVSKSVGDDGVSTTVRSVEAEDRVNEIARMLAGKDSATALAHARELLSEGVRGT